MWHVSKKTHRAECKMIACVNQQQIKVRKMSLQETWKTTKIWYLKIISTNKPHFPAGTRDTLSFCYYKACPLQTLLVCWVPHCNTLWTCVVSSIQLPGLGVYVMVSCYRYLSSAEWHVLGHLLLLGVTNPSLTSGMDRRQSEQWPDIWQKLWKMIRLILVPVTATPYCSWNQAFFELQMRIPFLIHFFPQSCSSYSS